MISAGDIRKRQMYLNMNNTLNEGSIDLLLENSKKTSSVSVIETYFKNWPYVSNGDSFEFTEAANILNGFTERANRSDSNKAIRLFSEMVLVKANDMKAAKKILQSLKINNESLITECNKYIVCDRIVNNHNRLVKKGIGTLMSESILVSENGIDNCVTSICEFIDNINMKFPIKYNVALENTIHLLDKQGISYDRKSVLESINDYFFINADNEKLKTMSIILGESEVYSDDEKIVLNEISVGNQLSVIDFINTFCKKEKRPANVQNTIISMQKNLDKVNKTLDKYDKMPDSGKRKFKAALFLKEMLKSIALVFILPGAAFFPIYYGAASASDIEGLRRLKKDIERSIEILELRKKQLERDLKESVYIETKKMALNEVFNKDKYISLDYYNSTMKQKFLKYYNKINTHINKLSKMKENENLIIPIKADIMMIINIDKDYIKKSPQMSFEKKVSLAIVENKRMIYQLISTLTNMINDDDFEVYSFQERLYLKLKYRIVNPSDTKEFKNIKTESIYIEADIVDKVKDKAVETSKSIITQLKSMPDKTPQGMKDAIKKLYTKSPENIVEETPNFLSWMRKFFVFSTLAINPYFGVVAFLVDMAIQTKLQQSETEKIIKSFKSELDKCEKKMGTCKTEKQEERLKAYKKELKKNIETLETYQDTLYSEKEKDERDADDNFEESTEFEFENHVTLKEYMEIYHPKVSVEMFKLRCKLDRYCNVKYKKLIDTQCILLNPISELKKFENSNVNSILGYIRTDSKVRVGVAKFLGLRYKELSDSNVEQRDILNDICDYLQLSIDSDFSVMYEGGEDMYTICMSYNKPILLELQESVDVDILKAYATVKILEEQASDISQKDMEYLLSFVDDNIDKIDMVTANSVGSFIGTVSDTLTPKIFANFFTEKADDIRKNEIGNGKYVKLAKLQESINGINSSTRMYDKYLSVYDTYDNNKLIQESIELMDQMTLNETSAVSTLKMVQQKLKKNMLKLSDKDKQLSRQLDFAVDSMIKKIQIATTNNNREAVIKGSIIPSASKLIKLAIGSTALFAVNPALAVIGILGGIAVSKKATNKEKQFILDEIDVQLQVVEKKIQLSDRSEDMKAMEELLKIEQRLKREKSRIEYNKRDYVPVRKD